MEEKQGEEKLVKERGLVGCAGREIKLGDGWSVFEAKK